MLRTSLRFRYIARVSKRILMSFLLAWLAIAPAVASSCASQCALAVGAIHGHAAHRIADSGATADVPDCHGAGSATEDAPESDLMATACLVDAAAWMMPAFPDDIGIDVHNEHRAFVLVPPVSFETCPPNKPPDS